MSPISVEEAQAKLPELIEHLAPGEEVVITRGERLVATLIAPLSEAAQPQFGRGRDKVHIISEDDEHLTHFRDHMP
jgi:antitoxin (DNA-binding transcriptional repressor) of toxin-antitoxin stability system